MSELLGARLSGFTLPSFLKADMGLRPYSRVVWSEGMHLAQHHFQAQSRYLEASAAFAAARLSFKPYGFLRLSMDEEAIQEGVVSITEAKGVMPDGLTFDFPHGDSLPPPVEANTGGGASGDPSTLFLAIPAFVASRSNCDEEDDGAGGAGSKNRYRAERVTVPDQNTGEDKRDLVLASKNFRIVYASELSEELVALPMARIRTGPGGHFEYIRDFIPPGLDVGATPRLPGVLG